MKEHAICRDNNNRYNSRSPTNFLIFIFPFWTYIRDNDLFTFIWFWWVNGLQHKGNIWFLRYKYLYIQNASYVDVIFGIDQIVLEFIYTKLIDSSFIISYEKNIFLEVLLAWHRKNIKSNVRIFWLKLRSTEQLKSLECQITMIQLFMTFQIMLCKPKIRNKSVVFKVSRRLRILICGVLWF